MGQIKIKGTAKKEFKADVMEITISISTKGETAALAVNKGKKETERVLQLLVDMGIDLPKVTMKKDKVSEPSRYNDEKFYEFEKDISLKTDANLGVLDILSSGIIDKEINATYTEYFSLSDVEAAQKEVLQEALLDAKKKAEAIAETLGQKVVGIECAKCDDYDEDDIIEPLPHKMCCLAEGSGGSLASQLSPDTISIDKSIDVSWVIE